MRERDYFSSPAEVAEKRRRESKLFRDPVREAEEQFLSRGRTLESWFSQTLANLPSAKGGLNYLCSESTGEKLTTKSVFTVFFLPRLNVKAARAGG